MGPKYKIVLCKILKFEVLFENVSLLIFIFIIFHPIFMLTLTAKANLLKLKQNINIFSCIFSIMKSLNT